MKTLIVTTATLAAFICAATPATAQAAACERGEFCLWPKESFEGDIHRVALENTNPGECVPLPDGFDARSFANLTKRPVTVYQGRDCSTEAEFDTYPGGGTFVPQAPYVVKGVQIWDY
ncbi:peptidase inhibitor family I36 protein [Actinophytocola sp.]|uniref:peptidase inhibitor family I36 protein n=1 Tax=Actinophytocola sp. TaxID=1872138 RepID=UPI002ED07DA1